MIAAAMLLLSMCIRSFALPIALSLVLAVIGVLFSNKGWGLYFPFSLICYGMNSNTDIDRLSGNMLRFSSPVCSISPCFLPSLSSF